MREIKETLTTEGLRSFFKNNFDLAHFSIEMGRYYMRAGHEISLTQLLDQVKKNPTEKAFQDLKDMDREEDDS